MVAVWSESSVSCIVVILYPGKIQLINKVNTKIRKSSCAYPTNEFSFFERTTFDLRNFKKKTHNDS